MQCLFTYTTKCGIIILYQTHKFNRNVIYIAIGQSVYCPNWIYTHSTDDYAAAGITPDIVAEKASAYSNFNLTENACAALADKLSVFTGEAISIEPIQVYADTYRNDFSYDISDDEMEDVDEDEMIVDEVVDEIK